MNIIPRKIEAIILQLVKKYQLITITGPRQSGKTTLVRRIFPDKKYINLENPEQRELALSDPRAFFH